MEGHLVWVEILALGTGLTVIAIETVIIIMLKNHIRALDSYFEATDDLISKFERKINSHLNHLNEHSHQIEILLQSICDHESTLHQKGSIRAHLSSKIETPEIKNIPERR